MLSQIHTTKLTGQINSKPHHHISASIGGEIVVKLFLPLVRLGAKAECSKKPRLKRVALGCKLTSKFLWHLNNHWCEMIRSSCVIFVSHPIVGYRFPKFDWCKISQSFCSSLLSSILSYPFNLDLLQFGRDGQRCPRLAMGYSPQLSHDVLPDDLAFQVAFRKLDPTHSLILATVFPT